MGEVSRLNLRDTDQFPLQTPFRRSDDEGGNTHYKTTHSRHFAKPTTWLMYRRYRQYNVFSEEPQTSKCCRALALTECSNAYASISAISTNSSERSMGIRLAYIRGNLLTLCLSFAGACRNMSDLGTKNNGNIGISKHFLATGKFAISFLGRKSAEDAVKRGDILQ